MMTPAEFAAHRGVKPSAVSNWKKAGLIVWAEGDGGRSVVDVARTEARLNANLDPARGRPTSAQSASAATPAVKTVPATAPAADDHLSTVRIELIRSQIVSRNLANLKEARELVPFAEYQQLSADNARLARERMHVMARNLAERLAAEKDPRQVASIMAAEIDAAFENLADEAEREIEDAEPPLCADHPDEAVMDLARAVARQVARDDYARETEDDLVSVGADGE